MAIDTQSVNDLMKRMAARGITATNGGDTEAMSDMVGDGILVTTVAGGSGGAVTVTDGTDTMLVNSDGSITAGPPRDAEVHAYAATATAGANTVIATITPTVVGVYEVVINYRISTGGSGEAVIDNMTLRNNAVAAMRLLTPPVPINSTSESYTVTTKLNWTTGAIDVIQTAASTSTNNTYRVSITAKRVG